MQHSQSAFVCMHVFMCVCHTLISVGSLVTPAYLCARRARGHVDTYECCRVQELREWTLMQTVSMRLHVLENESENKG